MGRRNVVEREPDMAEPECLLVLAINHIIVRIEPVGDCLTDCVSEQSGTMTE